MTTLNGDACPICGYAFSFFDRGACPRCSTQAAHPIHLVQRSRLLIEMAEDTLQRYRYFALWGLLALTVLELSYEGTLMIFGPLGRH